MARGSFWVLIGTVISQGLQLFASIVTARILGKAGFGELAIIINTVGMFLTFAAMGLGATANKHVAEFRVPDPARAGRIIGMSSVAAFVSGLVFTVVVLIFAPALAARTINAPQLAPELRLGSLILFLSVLNGAQRGALAGFEAFKTIAWVNLASGLLKFPLMVAGVIYWGLMGAVAGQVAGSAVEWFACWLALGREAQRAKVTVSYRRMREEWPILWSFSLPAVLTGTMLAVTNWGVSALLVNQPGGFAEMGLFRAANQWRMALLFIPQMLNQAVIPIMASALGEGRARSTVRMMFATMGANLVIILLPALAISIASPWIMAQYGPGFTAGWPVLIACLVGAAVIACFSPVASILVASGRLWLYFWMNLGWAVVMVVGAWGLLSQGALGLSLAYAVSYLIQAVFLSAYASGLIGNKGPEALKLGLKPGPPGPPENQ